MASTDPKTTFTITCTMNERWAAQFLGMLKRMQYLGSIGSSRDVTLFSDGDGDFRPKFEWEFFGTEPASGVGPDGDYFDAG